MFNCIIFYNSSKKYLQFLGFSHKFEFLVKSKIEATWTAILDYVTDPQQPHNP